MKNNFQSKAVPRGTRTIWRYLGALFLLFTFAIGNVWGAASTTTDGKYATGTIDFSTIGTLSGATTYWHNGVKFYSGNATSISANNTAWSTSVSIPAYVSNVTAGKDANKCKWGNGGTAKQYTQSGFACSQHTIGIHVNQACTLTVVVNKNLGSDTDDAGITASIDGVAYGTAYSSSTYKEAGSTALTVTSARADKTNASGRYTLTIVVTAGDLTDGEAVVKMFNGSSGSGAGKLFCWESITVTPAAVTKHAVTYKLNGATGTAPTQADVAEGASFTVASAAGITPPANKKFYKWNDGTNNYAAGDDYTMGTSDVTLTAQWVDDLPDPTATFADATYIIGSGTLNMASKFSSNSSGAVTYSLKEASANAEITAAGVFSATAAGEYVIVAEQAQVPSTYAAISKEATVTVLDNELSDTYVWKKNTSYGGDDKCISASAANVDPNANAAYKELDFSSQTMTGMSAMGRPAHDNDVVTLTFAVKDAYNSLFAIKSLCVYGKLDEAEGAEISWDNGANWTAIAKYSESKRTFDAPTGVYPANFKIRFTAKEVSQEKGGLWWRNALVTLEVKKTVSGVTEALVGAEINGEAISAANLSTLQEDKTLDIATAYAAAPTVTFKKQVTTSYEGGWAPDVTNVDVEVTASDNTTAWQASATIGGQAYTINLAKPAGPSLETEATAFTLTSAKIATDTESFTFSGMNLTSGNVTIALESPVAGMTVSPTEVTPTAGVITDQEVTITYKSLEDVAEAVVNLIVAYDVDTKITIPLTYSSTVGYEDLTPISAATTWNWDHANSSTEAIESLDANDIVVFANYSGWDESFKANSLAGRLQYVYRGNNYAQGHNLKFNTTVPGIVTVSFSNTSEKTVARAPRITDANGSYAPTDEADGAKTADAKSYSHAVAAGDVLIEGFEMQEGTPANMLRFYEVRFVPTFSVTYMPNGGSGAESIVDDAATEVRAGSIFTAPASSAFVEWNTQADGNGDTYLPGAAVTADLTLFAQWETSYMVTFDLQGHGDAIEPQNIVSGGKVVKPADPSADAWEFGGWYKESTCENEWNFATDVVTTTTTIFAKWTADPCPSPYSLSKVVLASATDGTVTGYNNDEYAGEKVIGGLNSTETAEVDPSHEGAETGYKLNNGGSAIVFATLKKGTFQVGDRVVVTITKAQDAYKVEEVAQPILDIYYGTDKNDATFLTTIENVTAAGTYTYRLTAADVTAIGNKKGIGVFRPSSGRTQNPYVYSVEIKGCREWAIFHTLTFKNIDGTATIAAESLEEGAYASTVAPVAPKIAMKRFLGWAEATDGTPVDLTTYTITEDKTLYAVYEDIVCPTNGTVYKFEIKDELPSENLPTSTDKDMSSYITATGDGYLTYTATANSKATINSDGTIQMKDASAAYLKVELECTLAAGDQIRAHVTNNPIRVQVGKTYDSDKDLILAKNAYEFVAITSAMEGKQVLYITRSSNGNAYLADFEIYRPAKYDVSFNMMGHGSAIADLEDVVEGSKIAAPSPAPTDVDYSFAGWYKENTLENEWKFDVDVVETNTTLYAKWLDKSDATLKSLKYGETEIALEADVYTYNVSLPAFTSAVPALTAETSNPNATKVIANAAAFDSEGNATSTVTVTPEVGADQVYYVNFAKGVEILLQDVTGSITWNFANAVTGTVNITETPQVLANYGGVTNDNTFESDKLEASGEKFTAGNKANLRANYIHFHTTVPGMLTISYSNTGSSNPARYIYVNGAKYDEEGSANTTPKGADNKVFVPAGDVELVMKDGEDASKNVQIYQMIFNATPDYTRPVTEGRYGTICLPNGGVMTGATIFEIAYMDYKDNKPYKIYFDEVLNGTMVAGMPYIFLPNESATQLGVFYTDAADAEEGHHNGLYGKYTKTLLVKDAGNYILKNNQYWYVNSDNVYCDANRAYIVLADVPDYDPGQPAYGRRRVSLNVNSENQAQGFENIETGDAPMKVMIDGSLYIIRGEKVFDATGRLVK